MKRKGYYQQLENTVKKFIEQTLQDDQTKPQLSSDQILNIKQLGLSSVNNYLLQQLGLNSTLSRKILIKETGLEPSTIQPTVSILDHLVLLSKQFGGVEAVIIDE